jgi:hypothetical protein
LNDTYIINWDNRKGRFEERKKMEERVEAAKKAASFAAIDRHVDHTTRVVGIGGWERYQSLLSVHQSLKRLEK